ncbi:TetR/AcrR family transcriptional regulator [Microbacterium sp. RD1]|uniref:TetR/AcrR family transcriptional regulator n=1 Tax=Microbacterium sp. RD1 TaxID=3457313 RepID=UPI003FA5F2A4
MAPRIYARKTAAILEAAEGLFLRRGYAATSMVDVAEEAGVSKQTLYSNFAGKRELFAAVIGRRSAVEFEVPDEVFSSGDLRGILVELGVVFLRHIYSPGQIELFQTVVAESRQFPELGSLMLSGPFVETPHVLIDVLRERAEAGELHFAEPALAPALFTSLLKADVHSRLLFSQPADTSPARLRALAESAVDIFLHGVAAPR